jgi:hypothetical protein
LLAGFEQVQVSVIVNAVVQVCCQEQSTSLPVGGILRELVRPVLIFLRAYASHTF